MKTSKVHDQLHRLAAEAEQHLNDEARDRQLIAERLITEIRQLADTLTPDTDGVTITGPDSVHITGSAIGPGASVINGG